MSARITMIAAVGANGVIGADNAMPWRLPTDFGYFKRVTMGKPLIMGRKTFESIGKPLPGRINIVVTSDRHYAPAGVLVAHNLEQALTIAETEAEQAGVDEIMIGGGGTIYAAMMPQAERLHITHVDVSPRGDTRFPPISPAIWRVAETPDVVPGDKDSAAFHIRVYERVIAGSH